ncbi:hypothetical protein [Piscirickettsia salmonis]|uniref:hypothetical protein n=1 Tax=Piscirickettsia salmonis TaxID=1238 RepID=UPI0004BCF221|nr:hypothetical protein [Piscirickettsia salmonis]QHS25840.1 hypothetical protein GW538_07655 [Piscirickettsia salmonis]QHS29178.1 hypothetical protein GW537_08745 [Piscirickettsia salmonis]
MLGDFASLDVQNTYRGSDAYVKRGSELHKYYFSAELWLESKPLFYLRDYI